MPHVPDGQNEKDRNTDRGRQYGSPYPKTPGNPIHQWAPPRAADVVLPAGPDALAQFSAASRPVSRVKTGSAPFSMPEATSAFWKAANSSPMRSAIRAISSA